MSVSGDCGLLRYCHFFTQCFAFSLQVKDQKPSAPTRGLSPTAVAGFFTQCFVFSLQVKDQKPLAPTRGLSPATVVCFHTVLCILAAGQRPETTGAHSRPESCCRGGGGRGGGGRGGSARGDGGAGPGASHRHQVRHFTLQLGSFQFRVVSVCSGKSIGTLPHFSYLVTHWWSLV